MHLIASRLLVVVNPRVGSNSNGCRCCACFPLPLFLSLTPAFGSSCALLPDDSLADSHSYCAYHIPALVVSLALCLSFPFYLSLEVSLARKRHSSRGKRESSSESAQPACLPLPLSPSKARKCGKQVKGTRMQDQFAGACVFAIRVSALNSLTVCV